MAALARDLGAIAADTGFSGVVRVDGQDGIEVIRAYGLADRAHGIPNEADTQFGVASGSKGFTALVVMRLVEDGVIELSTTARSILGSDLPLIDDRVTVEHLLAHRSGIGDYLDEELDLDLSEYLMPVPVQQLASTESYLDALDGHAQKFEPGERFAYCNGGYVVLALIAERAARAPFHELVHDLVCSPAEMSDTAFLRSDELPGRAAFGYVQVDGAWRTNVFHLPIRGSGDGGAYTTAADVAKFWRALFAGSIVGEETLVEMLRKRSDARADRGYGLGFWLPAESGAALLVGSDSGVAFRSAHDPDRDGTWTLLSNTRDGPSAIAGRLEQERTGRSSGSPR
ncbi:MAG TPA: serine hydrolase domain-containing protein [Gaiellaceae bacterium]|jgi:CubicO group peptidase (beta-lactamase class C family)